ncbi:MAG TPA: ABC transporter substrate-binding protein [Opitutaceae bacterium]|jgi:ABC-type nitrate/sulfonate/bicarbonate transport system substrate-binding protein|nr:ABC transporter substrate-binding protein [Opitutaceae bacterium]
MTRLLRLLLPLMLASVLRAESVTVYPDWFPGAQFSGLYAAIDQGFYREQGIEVQLVPFAFGQKTAARIEATPEQCAVAAIEGYIFLQARARGTPWKVLAAMFQESPAGYLSLAATGIRGAADFRGRRIGVHHHADPLYRWFLARAGVKESEATLVFTGDDIDALVRGDLHALQGYSIEEYIRLQSRVGAAARFVSFRTLGFDSYSELLVTSPAQVQRHGATLERFLEATRRGWRHALAHPDSTVQSVARRMDTPPDPAHLRASLAALAPLVSPAGAAPLAPLSRAKWNRMQEAGIAMGFLEKPEPPEDFVHGSLAP